MSTLTNMIKNPEYNPSGTEIRLSDLYYGMLFATRSASGATGPESADFAGSRLPLMLKSNAVVHGVRVAPEIVAKVDRRKKL